LIKELQEPSTHTAFHHLILLKVKLDHQPTPQKDVDVPGRMVPYPRHEDEISSTYLPHSIIIGTPCHDKHHGAF
jgi:hypothetical protein